MMERIEMLRAKLDRIYNATVFRLIGALGICYAARACWPPACLTACPHG